MSLGKALVTADGINAILNAASSGSSVKPKYFKCSNQDLVLDANLSAKDINGWRTQDIDLYQVMDENTIEFVCDVVPTEAVDYIKTIGLYLDDGTLFMVARPPYPFPPGLRQTLKVQLSYSAVTGVMDFKYVSHQETEQDLNLLNSNVVQGNQILKNTIKIEKLKIKGVN